MSRILVDMDGPSADWTGGVEDYFFTNDLDREVLDWSRWDGISPSAPAEAKTWVKWAQATKGFYANLKPMDGVREAVEQMVAEGHEVFFCSTPDVLNATCASDKIDWLETYIGQGWSTKLILTHDKTLVHGDFLIDDKPCITGARTPEWKHIVWDTDYNQPEPGDMRARLYYWNEWELVIPKSLQKREKELLKSTGSEVRTTSSTGGQKGTKDERFDLIPSGALTTLARHYGIGARKYDDNQWRKGYEWSKSYAAMQRHLNLWHDGEDIDEETQSPHLAAAAWHCFTLLTFADEHPNFDDRYKGEKA